jgi:hypothetical protein
MMQPIWWRPMGSRTVLYIGYHVCDRLRRAFAYSTARKPPDWRVHSDA